LICIPEIARAITSCWISAVPSRMSCYPLGLALRPRQAPEHGQRQGPRERSARRAGHLRCRRVPRRGFGAHGIYGIKAEALKAVGLEV